MPGRTPLARSLGVALAALVAVALVLGLVETALVLTTPGPTWAYVGTIGVAGVYLGAGVLAWWWRPTNRIGLLLVTGAGAWLLAGLVNTEVPLLAAAGLTAATASMAVLVHLLLAFPTGRLLRAPERVVAAAGWVTALVLQAPLWLFVADPPPHHLLWVADRPDLAAAGAQVQRFAGVAVVVATAAIVLRRLLVLDRDRRRVLLPLSAYGLIAALLVPVGAAVEDLLGMSPPARYALQLVLLGGVPVAFLLGILRGGFARTGEIDELASWLGAADRPDLARSLGRALGDPSVEIVFWLPETARYVDAAGLPADPLGPHRAVVPVELAGERVGAIVYDTVLQADPAPVAQAGRVMALAVERDRLTAELRARDAELRRSRLRLVEAADRERRRIARDLHDGVQLRLVLLALEADRIPRAGHLRRGIDDAATELRALVHAVMPAALVERGLAAATEDLVDRVPLPTRLHLAVDDGTLPTAVETTAYFVVAEGLTNALKHSGATRLGVRVTRSAAAVRVEVTDDGRGGAGAGGGLHGLADRVGAVGGTLTVDSPPGEGTRLLAELPCES
jgi:signal transduction histidine kinase